MTSTNDSPTKVNPSRSHGVGLWNNKRKVVGIRVDENLYEAFKPVAKRVFGSVCRPIEAFMASVIALAETGVNFGETVKIGHLHIERNLRPRRRLAVEADKSVNVESAGMHNKCAFCDRVPEFVCHVYAKENARERCVETYVCKDHFFNLKKNQCCRGWGKL